MCRPREITRSSRSSLLHKRYHSDYHVDQLSRLRQTRQHEGDKASQRSGGLQDHCLKLHVSGIRKPGDVGTLPCTPSAPLADSHSPSPPPAHPPFLSVPAQRRSAKSTPQSNHLIPSAPLSQASRLALHPLRASLLSSLTSYKRNLSPPLSPIRTFHQQRYQFLHQPRPRHTSRHRPLIIHIIFPP